MRECGVTHYMVSSTCACTDDVEHVLSEMQKLISIDVGRVYPCLWLTETTLQSPAYLKAYMESGVEWKCLKIHPALRPTEWQPLGYITNKLFKLAASMGNLPILIHTGEDSTCNSSKYEAIITANPQIPVILAHGRPLVEAIGMVQKYDNIYVDSAFMPVSDICRMVREVGADRLLWGTDFCIPKIFDGNINLKEYYKHKLMSLRNSLDSESYSKVIGLNALALLER